MLKIIAHRGYTANHLENTLEAFKVALDFNADAIELDVHFTSDNQLVVHHDYYLGNPDNGEGLIFRKPLSYIQDLTINDKYKIPTLEEVFELVGNNMQYELELKGFTNEFLQALIAMVQRFKLAKHIEFTSPNVYTLTRLKEIAPDLKTGVFIAQFPDWMDKELGQTLAMHNALLGGAAVLHCPLDVIDDKFIELARSYNLQIHAADCNTEEELRLALGVGVDQLSTDELELALATREKLSAKN